MASKKSFDKLRAAQIADHGKWFGRVELSLPATANSATPTDARLVGFAKGAEDPALAALYFNFGRYPTMKESAMFYLDNLIEEPKNRWLVTGPSNSPENRFTLPDGKVAHVCLGPTVDMQLLRELFGNTARAAEILSVDAGLRRELLEKRAHLAPNQIGPDGRLQEWLEPYPEPEPTHRHTSHLYGLHPSNEVK